jgi:CRP/FNR family transcriptional regulator
MHLLHVRSGSVVFDERQACQGFPLIAQGCIRVVKPSAQGRELPLYRVQPGDTCVISSSCLLGRSDYNVRGIAEEDSTLVLLSPALFDELLATPDFRQFVFGTFAQRMAELMQLVEEVAFQKLDQRLAQRLLGHGPQLNITHQQLADELGSVREMVSRLLKGFADQGWVRLGRERIDILNAQRLRHVSQGLAQDERGDRSSAV